MVIACGAADGRAAAMADAIRGEGVRDASLRRGRPLAERRARRGPTPVPRPTMRSPRCAGSSKPRPRPRGCRSDISPSSSGAKARSGRTPSVQRARKGWPSSCRAQRPREGSPIRSIRRRRFPRRRSIWRELVRKFGNLGLAAAAYNAGETAVDKWLDDKGQLPFETQDYVLAITGHAADEWRTPTPPELAAPEGPSCLSLIASLRTAPASRPSSRAGLRPGACRSPPASRAGRRCARLSACSTISIPIVGGKNPFVLGSVVRSRGFRPFYRVRLPAQNRPEAEKLCAALEAAGGACVVLRS